MAAKRKTRVPEQMVSKSVPTFRQQFVNASASELYQQFVRQGQQLIVECDFAPSGDPPDGRLIRQITRLGWTQLCDQKCAANVVVVQEFYANAFNNRPGNVVLVRGKDVTFTPEAIR